MASQYNLNTRTQNRSFRNWILCFASGISIAAAAPYALAQDDVDDTVETTSDVVEDAQNELDKEMRPKWQIEYWLWQVFTQKELFWI